MATALWESRRAGPDHRRRRTVTRYLFSRFDEQKRKDEGAVSRGEPPVAALPCSKRRPRETRCSAPVFNKQHMSFASPDIVAEPPFTVSPSDTIRWKAWGMPSTATNATQSNTEVISMGNSVIGKLASGDIRSNYLMSGATWTIEGAVPTPVTQVGTNLLGNTTMETYQQGDSTKAQGASNCFGCHTSNMTGLSHVFDELQPLFP